MISQTLFVMFAQELKYQAFSISMNKAAHMFDLVNYDIYGSYTVALIISARYFLTLVQDKNRSVRIDLL